MTYQGSSGPRYRSCRASRGSTIVFTFEPIPIAPTPQPLPEEHSLMGPSHGAATKNDEITKYFMIVEAILTSQNYPTRKLSHAIYKRIEDEVQNLKKASRERPLLVKVHSPDRFTNSSVQVDCIGLDMENFFEPLKGIKIRHINLKVILKKLSIDRLRVTIELKYVSGLRVIAVLDRLQLCYPNLNTSEWYVIKSIMDDNTLKITVLMDKFSADYIRECGYVLEWVHPESEQWYTDESESE